MARSYLFAPGDNLRLLSKVFTAGADAVILDLEDAVPEKHKTLARAQAQTALVENAPTSRSAPWVRINSLDSEHWRQDIRAVVVPGLVGLRVPKAESAQELDMLHEELREAEANAGLEQGQVQVACTIESAVGVLEARSLAQHQRVSHLCFGEADFIADIGAELGAGSQATLFARSALVIAARAARIAPPIAAVYTRLNDETGLLKTTLENRQLGFFGRSCIHPRQLSTLHQVFTPKPHEIRQAREVIATYEEGSAGTAVTQSGHFVDLAVVRRARGVLELAELVSSVEE